MNFTLHTDNSFTLTCISTGGPATTVTWTRDSTTVTQGTQTVLNDGVTAQYTHTLTDRTAGLYTCVVANNVSNVSAKLPVQGPSPPSNVRVSQNGLNSLLVTWTPSEGPNATGYTVYYYQINGGFSGSVTAAATDTSVVITGLIAGAAFSISVSADSSTLSSSRSRGPDTLIVPATISLTSSPPSPMMSGATVSLTCSISLPIDVTDATGIRWNGPGVTPTPVNSITSGKKISSVLTFSGISTSQGGFYRCNFTLGGSISVNITVSVLDQVIFLPAVRPDVTIISLSWIPASGVPVTTYNISYSNTDKKCFDDNKAMSIENQTLNATLEELEEHTEYLVKVAVWYEGRVVGSNSIVVTTKPVAPSSSPSSVSVAGVTSSAITVMWRSVPCIHQNGDITGYLVQYGVMRSENKETMETSETEITLLSLTPETDYEISVAAVNTEGIGVSTNTSATTSAERATSISNLAVAAPTSGAVIGVLLLILLVTVLLIVFVRYRSGSGDIHTSTNEAYGNVG
ncbi:Receptor-type tyrosine-protein phosphatase delta, partial [Geodia barretti]